MTRLNWDELTSRVYEVGVDRGVLYPNGSSGVAWSGLISVTEDVDGGASRPYYLDGIKYLNLSAHEEFKSSVESFSAPREFLPCDGMQSIQNGLIVTHQPRKTFGFSYRTLVGNFYEKEQYGYKIHIVYNALAAPSNRKISSLGRSVTPTVYNWEITTQAPIVSGYRPTAHFIIDSVYTDETVLATLEDILYGSISSNPRLPDPTELISIFNS